MAGKKIPNDLLEKLQQVISPYKLEYFVCKPSGSSQEEAVMGICLLEDKKNLPPRTWNGLADDSLNHNEFIQSILNNISSGELDLDTFFVEVYQYLLEHLDNELNSSMTNAVSRIEADATKSDQSFFKCYKAVEYFHSILTMKANFLTKYSEIYKEIEEKGTLKQGIKLTQKPNTKGTGLL